jgi:hypothetical protein
MVEEFLDITFDFRTDAGGSDPDATSPTLKRYHRILWSKILPNGGELVLDKKLNSISEATDFSFGSDSIIHSFSKWAKYQHIIKQIPEQEIENFIRLGYTMGGMVIFPRNKVNNCQTINQSRGVNHKIKDRFDLTLECIRKYYNNEESPLSGCFDNYSSFFAMFCDFKGYVDFFLLQDLVDGECSEVRFFHPFNNFEGNPLPKTVDEYLKYKEKSMEFIEKRNERIVEWVKDNKESATLERYL